MYSDAYYQSKEDDLNFYMNILKVMLAMLVILVILFTVVTLHHNSITSYKMPNGVICEDQIPSSSAKQFKQCDDGKVYINPKTYIKVRA